VASDALDKLTELYQGDELKGATERIDTGIDAAEGRMAELSDRPMQAFGRGIFEGIVPLDLRSDYDVAVDEDSPFAKGSGKTLGFLGGAMTGTGLPGLGTKLGMKAAGKIAGTAVGKGLLARGAAKAGGLAVGGAIEGATVGVHEGTIASQHEDISGIPAVGAVIANNVGTGMAYGAGFNFLGAAFPATFNILFKARFKNMIGKTREALKTRRNANKAFSAMEAKVQAEIDNLAEFSIDKTIKPATGKAVVFDDAGEVAWERATKGFGMEDIDARNMPRQLQELIGTPGQKTIRGGGGKRTVTSGAYDDYADLTITKQNKATRDAAINELYDPHAAPYDPNLRSPAYDSAAKAMQNADNKVRQYTEGSLTQLASDAKKAMDTGMQGAVLAGSGFNPVGRAARVILPKFFGAIDTLLLAGTDKIKPLRKLVGRSLKAGELTLDNTTLLRGEYVRTASKRVQKFRQARSASKLPLVAKVTDDEFREMIEELNERDPDQMEQGLRFAMASHGIPQEAANPLVDQMRAVHQHLVATAPAQAYGGWLGIEPQAVNEQAKQQWLRRARMAVGGPMLMMEDLADGKVTPESADTFWATNPNLAQMAAKHLEMGAKYMVSLGHKYTPEQKRQISLMVNRGQDLGRSYSPKLLQLLQGQHQESQERTPAHPQGAQQPVNIDGFSEAAMVGAQGVGQRLGM
jgi:hypothetical protein